MSLKEYEGKMNADDAVHAYHLHSRGKFRRNAVLWFIVSTFTLALQFWGPRPNLVFVAIAIALPGHILYQRYVCVPKYFRREFRQNPAHERPFRTLLDESGFETWQGDDHAKRQWTDIRSWVEDDRYFLLYESDQVYHTVPKRHFENDLAVEEFRALLNVKIGRKK